MGLLPRMEARVGVRATSYRYHPIDGKPIALGHDRAEAIRRVLDMARAANGAGSVRWVWERYRESPRFLRLAPATRADYEQCSVQILAVLGAMPIGAVDAPMVARYVRIERADAPARANREKALLSNLFFHGIDLGACRENPARSVQPNIEEPRTEAPDPQLLARFLAWVARQSPQRRIVGLAAQFASLAGARKVEFLDLAWPQVDFDAGVVRMKRAKQRGRKRGEVVDEVALSPALRECLEALAALRRGPECLAVFPQRSGAAYSARGFKTLWGRIVVAAIEAEVIPADARFTFHDLRAYYATQHKTLRGDLPDLHKDPGTTARVYDRNRVVKRSGI